jgi:hypothetical protein
MAFDTDSSTVWTGHADGAIKVHRMKAGMSADAADLETSLAVQHCQQGVPVCSLAIEAQGDPRCWAGDVEGRVLVLKLTTTHAGQLHLLHNTTGAAPQAAQSCSILRACDALCLFHSARHALAWACLAHVLLRGKSCSVESGRSQECPARTHAACTASPAVTCAAFLLLLTCRRSAHTTHTQ